MKKLLAIIIGLLFSVSVHCFAGSAEITFEWNQDMTVPVVGWKLYQSETSGVYGTTPFQVVTYDGTPRPAYQSTVTITIPTGVQKKFFWVVTAYNTDQESGRSNEVSTDHYFPLSAPMVPVTLKATVRSIP